MPTALVANPNADVVDHGSRRWILFGTHRRELRTAIEQGSDFETVRDLTTSLPGEGTVVVLSEATTEPTIRAHRGITSTYEVYYCRDSSGEPVVTDLFRNALARLDPDDRVVPDRAIADHVLYRTTPMNSYVDRVHRLGHGETLTWTPGETTPRTELTETLEPDPTVATGDAVDRLDEVLSAVCAPVADSTLMLSGGVDSTVLDPYLANPTESVTGSFDTPELDFESEYARTASELVDTDHEVVEMAEADYLERLEAAVDALGMPPHQLQTPTFDGVFRGTDARTLVCGQTADAVFGLSGSLERGRNVWRTRHLRYAPTIGDTLRDHRTVLDGLERHPSDPDGQAMQFAAYTDVPSAVETIGRRRYERRQRARYEYAMARVPSPTGDRYAQHMHLGHWVDFFCEDAGTVWRQTGLARGCEMYMPFAGKGVAELALGVRSPERYVDGGEAKHLPKKLLAEWYPEYDRHKPKGNGNFPADRFLTSGPLAAVFDRYEVPEFVPDSVLDGLVDRAPGFAWSLAGYAIWRDRVLRADDLEPAAHTRSVSVAPTSRPTVRQR
ncbi:asparagine synthase C-terminal domain-containing protein [Halobacteria archaeon AArc-m2/3/4]|uniref:Asparagine synthase C-terminal domain-containing protein n=1 Tax=Natronoglomus mannanivorans TaxID=2979990 RepID=A0ABT2Q8D0_9EURY|nr:asparagine synthase C-terminal domain-containing protein [Halobacteria archaeon AArc-m2/3/4]